MKLVPETAARRFVEAYFPDAGVAILSGSVVQGLATPFSDLDIVIFDPSQRDSFRKTFFDSDWKIEAFVLKPEEYEDFCEESRIAGIPTLQRMCADGTVIVDDGSAASIIETARQNLRNGPLPWTTYEINRARYEITECLEDLSGSNHRSENLFVVNKLAQLVHEFALRANNQWIGDGKWIVRSLRMFDESFCREFIAHLETFYRDGEKQGLIDFVDVLLERFGGRLTAGYFEGNYFAWDWSEEKAP